MARLPKSTDASDPTEIRVTHVEQAMGTFFSIALLGASEHRLAMLSAIHNAVEWLHEVDHRFTTFTTNSEWMRYTRGQVNLDDAHPDLRHVVEATRRLTDETKGDFSLTANPNRPPDPAAYVKGWAIQRAAELLLASRAHNVFVNGGGDIAVTKRSPPWRIGIQHPKDPAALVAILEIDHGAVATSGAYERGDHVFDAGSGQPSNALASATVTGPDLGLADAYSTALFAKGEQGLHWLAGHEGYGAYLVRADETTLVAGAIKLSHDDMTDLR
jgi:thiamine biosynthesis lipoprotein